MIKKNVISSDHLALFQLPQALVHLFYALIGADFTSLSAFCNVHLKMVHPAVPPVAQLTCEPPSVVKTAVVVFQTILILEGTLSLST